VSLCQADRDVLNRVVGSNIRFDEPMSRHTTLRIGGPADAWCIPDTIEAVIRVLMECRRRAIPVLAVGSGSNLLVRDGGIRGVVIGTSYLREVRREQNQLIVQAGVSTGKILSMATKWGLGGAEFLAGVPGSVGGGVIMNAGTALGEFKDITESVDSVRIADGNTVTREANACGFEYRHSCLGGDEIVLGATLRLSPRDEEEIRAAVRELRDRRKLREPHRVSNAGSVFKNPQGDHAGRLLEAVGLKGTVIGGAMCSPVHANWFVNESQASAADMLALIDMAREKVRDTFGIALALEWKVVGENT